MATIYQMGIQKRKPLRPDNAMATRYQRGNQKRKSLKTRQCNGHKIPEGYSET